METPAEPHVNKNIIGVVLLLAGIATALYHWVYQPSIIPKTPPSPSPVTHQTTPPPSTSKPTPAPAPSNAAVPQPPFTSSIQVAVRGFAFIAQSVRVKAGTKIIWTNFDTAGHTVTSNTGVFTSKILSEGKSFEYIFNKPGIYPYHCTLHPDMKGEIDVE